MRLVSSIMNGLIFFSCVCWSVGCQSRNEEKNRSDSDRVERPAEKVGKTRPDERTNSLPSAIDPPPKLLSDQQLSEGWIALFDGQTLFGWHCDSKEAWRVEGGAVVAKQGKPGLLRTTTPFADYVLELEFRGTADAVSSVLLSGPAEGADPATNCYEVGLTATSDSYPPGSLVQRKAAAKTAVQEGSADQEDWQSLEVRLEGGHVVVQLDSRLATDFTDPKPVGRGYIGLRSTGGAIQFRNIRLKPLGLVSLLNGKDLTGWKTYPDMKSVFTVTKDGVLNVKNGRGQLETEKKFGDFVLQLECISHAEGLNSGIFFRCIPGEQMNGYESQIHNLFKDGDRTKPVDCGTGGIFRRKDARYVIADDLVWFHDTIIASGPHVAGWVNGYQVTDWTDTRPPNANPRRGLRLESGTIMIQGHDPTTDLSFRNLRAVELPKRKVEH